MAHMRCVCVCVCGHVEGFGFVEDVSPGNTGCWGVHNVSCTERRVYCVYGG